MFTAFDYVGKYAIISGWGSLKYKGSLSQFPFEAVVCIISDDRCKAVESLGAHFEEDSDAMFCAYSKNTDACQVSRNKNFKVLPYSHVFSVVPSHYIYDSFNSKQEIR